jgi:hypothetical protein
MKRFISLLGICMALSCFAEDEPILTQSEPSGELDGHTYINLGLTSGTWWATCNLGATSCYEYGSYCAWGEVESKELFTTENYAYTTSIGDYGVYEVQDLGSDISGTQYDAASSQWGGRWRMPNEQERYELFTRCWWRFTSANEVPGLVIYGTNGNTLFLPAAGYGGDESHPAPYGQEVFGYYWTGEASSSDNNKANGFHFGTSGMLEQVSCDKTSGFSIRPVINRNEAATEQITANKQGASITYTDGQLQISGVADRSNVQLYDLSGRLLMSSTVRDGFASLPSLSAGVYIARSAACTKKICVK